RKQLGLGHAVLCARPLIGEQPFVVALGDSIIGVNAQSSIVRRMIEEFERSSADAVIAFEEVPPEEVVQYGIARPQDRARPLFALADIIEKPSVTEAPSNLAVAARYVFGPGIFALLAQTPPGKGGEIQLTDAIRTLIRNGGRVLGMQLPPQERRYDIGNFESYFQAFCEFALADPRYGPAFRAYMTQLLASPPGVVGMRDEG